jgi:hypothetical protein
MNIAKSLNIDAKWFNDIINECKNTSIYYFINNLNISRYNPYYKEYSIENLKKTCIKNHIEIEALKMRIAQLERDRR